MKLQHYLGGLEGLPEPMTLEKRVFVEDWEQRIFGIHVAMMGLSNHLGSALPEYPIDEVPTAFKDEWTWADLRTGAEAMNPFDYFKFRYYEKWLGGITQFFIDKVRITNVPADAHSRLPGYLRERVGTVERVFEGDYGYFTDTGDGIGDPMPIYIVEFDPVEIWGPRAEDGPLKIYAELFEAYLAPIEEKI